MILYWLSFGFVGSVFGFFGVIAKALPYYDVPGGRFQFEDAAEESLDVRLAVAFVGGVFCWASDTKYEVVVETRGTEGEPAEETVTRTGWWMGRELVLHPERLRSGGS